MWSPAQPITGMPAIPSAPARGGGNPSALALPCAASSRERPSSAPTSRPPLHDDACGPCARTFGHSVNKRHHGGRSSRPAAGSVREATSRTTMALVDCVHERSDTRSTNVIMVADPAGPPPEASAKRPAAPRWVLSTVCTNVRTRRQQTSSWGRSARPAAGRAREATIRTTMALVDRVHERSGTPSTNVIMAAARAESPTPGPPAREAPSASSAPPPSPAGCARPRSPGWRDAPASEQRHPAACDR